jgi:hypothetical protein
MSISLVSASSFSPKTAPVQPTKPPTPVAVTDPDRDGDSDKVGKPDTNDRSQETVGSLLNAKA